MRWRWIWGPVVAAALLAALLLPSRGAPISGGLPQLIEIGETSYRPATFRDDVQAALRFQRARLRAIQREDSLANVAARGPWVLRGWDAGLTVVYEPPVGAVEAGAWLAAAEKELRRYPGAPMGGAPLVIALYGNPARARTTEFATSAWWTRRLLPDSLHAACIVEVNLVSGQFGRRHARPTPQRAFLGLCGLARQFGAPGPEIARWITAGGFRGDVSDDPTWGVNWSTVLAEAGDTVPRLPVAQPEFSWGQAGWQWYWGVPWVPIGCLHGAASLCERNAHIRGSAGIWWGGRDPRAMELVARLVRTGTPAQFAAFWRSPLAVSDALRRAYLRPAGALAHDAFTHWYFAAPGGPRAGPRLVLAGAIWAAAALALALVAGRRRTTEI